MRAALLAAGASLLLSACASDLSEAEPLPALDEPFFRCRVQPVLTKSCSQLLCHGDTRRFYTVFGRNRLRLRGTERERNAQLRDEERQFNFASSLAYVSPGEPGSSLLLLKPLDQTSGGYYHGGEDEFDRGDVFADSGDPDFQTIAAWINGDTEEAGCIEPGSTR